MTDAIEHNGKRYPTTEVYLDDMGGIVAPESLEDECDRETDEMIFFYVPDELFDKGYDAVAEFVKRNVF